MTYRRDVVTGCLVTVIATGASVGTWWLLQSHPSSSAATAREVPAWVAHKLDEDQVNTVVLSTESVARLALQVGVVEHKSVPRSRVYGGAVVVPVGRSVQVSAPLSGTLKAAAPGLPAAGQPIRKGQPVFQLFPLLTPEGRASLESALAEVEGQYRTAEAQCAACRIFLDRAMRVLQSEAGSQRAVDEAQANLNLALKTCEAAKARRDLLARIVKDAEDGNTRCVTIESPEAGILRTVSALPGQQVAAGGALFEVVNLERVWIRVPVYVGDLKEIDVQAPAAIGGLAMRPGQPTRPGTPVPAPPSADASAGTVDLYYEVDNSDRLLGPGERVGVSLALTGATACLTVPWSAIIHDIHGGTWVYQELRERVFARRRVEVRYVVDSTAVLAAGPRQGTRVVTAGAAELFGTETGFTK